MPEVEVADNIGLDDAAQILSAALAERPDIEHGPLTWRDASDAFDTPFATDRAKVNTPESVGVRVRKGAMEGELVLFAGGWADLVLWDGLVEGRLVQEAPGYESDMCVMTISGWRALVTRLVGFFEAVPGE